MRPAPHPRAGFTSLALGALTALAAFAAPHAHAQEDVRLVGVMSQRALLVIGGQQPRLVATGSSLQGVKVLQVTADSATLEYNGQRHTVRLGQTPVRMQSAKQSLTLRADNAGHFQSEGSINDQPVQFMIDTGATAIAIGSMQARQLGLDYLGGSPVIVGTANGSIQGWQVTLRSVKVGSLVRHNVAAIVTPQAMPYVLLGNSFLQHYQMTREADLMRLQAQ